MREIRGDTGGVDDIVEGKLVNERRSLQQEGEGLFILQISWGELAYQTVLTDLANATRGSENN